MIEREIESLRREFGKTSRGPGERYPSALKARAIELAHKLRSSGATWSEIASALSLHMETVRCWCNEKSQARLRPVEIVPDEADKKVCVVAPSGVRIEGITLEEALTLLERLR